MRKMSVPGFSLFFGLLITMFNASAQEEPSLEVTYAYINKKAQEANGHYRYHLNIAGKESIKFIYTDISVGHIAKTNEIQIKYIRNSQNIDYTNAIVIYEFKPIHIQSIEMSKRALNDPVGLIVIKLSGKTGKQSSEFEERLVQDRFEQNSSDEMLLPFLQSDTENFNKIKKALEHLKVLSKDEEFDPFGE
ncbi:MAG: hypothetical protein AB9834_02000 [Lentimicrobium sp.]